MRTILRSIWTFPRRVLVLLIEIYQRTLSPDHGPLKPLFPYGYCRHSPTCSAYAKETVMVRGLIVGSMLSIWRVLCCNPWSKVSEKRILEVAGKQ